METIAAAFLVWCEKHLGKAAAGLKLAVGHDSRISADRISAALQRVFVRYGVQVLDCGLASTPSMFWATLDLPLRLLGADHSQPPPLSPQRAEILHPQGAWTPRTSRRSWPWPRRAPIRNGKPPAL